MGRADDPQAVVDPLLRFVTIQVLKIIILLVNFIITTNLTGELVWVQEINQFNFIQS